MKNRLPILACISFSTFLLSLWAPVIKQPAYAQTASQNSTSQNSGSIEASPLQVDDEAIDDFVEALMTHRQIPGLSLAVIYDQKLIKTTGYGMLDRELNVHTRPSSIFPIASMSKPLTATAIMLLVQDGRVDLDAPIGTYLADVPEHWSAITVRHLLSHTSGLSEGVYADDLFVAPDEFVEKAAIAPLNFQPGESWMYSNTGYSLASIIVETVSQQSFDAFMSARIFEPLGMTQTHAIRDSYLFSNRAMGYLETEDGSLEPVSEFFRYSLLHKIMPGLQGAGSVTSTVLDLARWEIALQKEQFLTPAVQAEMQQVGILNSGRVSEYGLGWFFREINGHSSFSHGGNLWGYSTSISRFPDDRLAVIVLTNKDGEDGDQLARKIAERYIPGLVLDLEVPAISDDDPALTEKILVFLNGDETAIELTPERQIALTSTLRGQFYQSRWAALMQENPTQSLELLTKEVHPNGIKRRYRATAKDGVYLLTVVVTPDGLIASMGRSSEE
ncbi:MAG: serine hydrolase domain-containing protein [Cyanobacteria bacterium J06598_1]